jgi:hypothetical protein
VIYSFIVFMLAYLISQIQFTTTTKMNKDMSDEPRLGNGKGLRRSHILEVSLVDVEIIQMKQTILFAIAFTIS